MKTHQMLVLAGLALALPLAARAADVAGKWHAEFDTQIGLQKYTFEFTVKGDTVTGKAAYERENGSGEVQLRDVKVQGDSISFVEPLKFDDQEISITYQGTVKGDEMKLTRQVGDFATEELVAKRVTAPAKPAK